MELERILQLTKEERTNLPLEDLLKSEMQAIINETILTDENIKIAEMRFLKLMNGEKIAEMHIDIYGMLHSRMVALITEQKEKGAHVPPEMQAIWDYEHERLIKEFAEAKFLVEEYKKAY